MSKGTAKATAEKQDLVAAYRATETELRREFPELFEDCASLSCPPGWYQIVRALASQVKIASPELRVEQMKPKAGTLRFYYSVSYHNQTVNLLVNLASKIAGQTCETCGAPGKSQGWHVRCEGCAS